MKQFYHIISFLLAFSLGSVGLGAAPLLTAAPDTLNRYYINDQLVKHFDGSQIAGKKVTSYNITTVSSNLTVIKIHNIHTEGSPQPTVPVYVIDGKQVPKAVFEQLNPMGIKSITIIKDVKQDDLKRYSGWENGVILVETKNDGTPIFSTERWDRDNQKIISIRGESRE